MATKPITNQRTKKEIREEVVKIDNEIPKVEPVEETTEDQVEVLEEAVAEEIHEDIETQGEETLLEEKQEEPVLQPKKELPPIEERYSEAGQEAMVLNSKNRKIMETIEEAENLPEPTVEELKEYAKQMGEDYDNLDNFAKNILKESFQNKRKLFKIGSLVIEEKQMNTWVKKVEEFVNQEDTLKRYPPLSGQEEEFVRYCAKRSHVGVDLYTLVAGFMWKQSRKVPVRKSVLLPSSRGGSGSPNPKASAEPTEDDAAIDRVRDPKKYKQMIKSRKYKTTI